LKTGESVSVTANDDGSFGTTSDGSPPLLLAADPSDKIEIEFTDDADNTVSFYPGPFRNEDGTTIINSDGGTVEDSEGTGIRAVVPRDALPDGTPVRVENIAAYNVLEATGAEGFDFFGGISLTIPEDLYAEKEIGLSVPIPDGSDILPEDRILLFKEIEFFGRTGVMLVNTAHVNSEEGRIETASPPFPGARSKGRYMFFKPLYPDKMVIVTPSPTFGVGLVGM
ncbi:MAG: hypothetical protein GY715_09980, partial [Planctomycetes bacterium]|nr:hypothetical protein [Planctomycetota bacterium]